ncbi:MAG: hypothetical protein IPI04_02765 [Ignavibacteria bacterium]|nr:hypothetical protein [Ignavibacteria bacterium]
MDARLVMDQITGGNTGASCYDCHTGSGRTTELPFMSWRNYRSQLSAKGLNGETSVSSLGVGVQLIHRIL